jgi:hypothetical protein
MAPQIKTSLEVDSWAELCRYKGMAIRDLCPQTTFLVRVFPVDTERVVLRDGYTTLLEAFYIVNVDTNTPIGITQREYDITFSKRASDVLRQLLKSADYTNRVVCNVYDKGNIKMGLEYKHMI